MSRFSCDCKNSILSKPEKRTPASKSTDQLYCKIYIKKYILVKKTKNDKNLNIPKLNQYANTFFRKIFAYLYNNTQKNII